ncbi:MULTISPECIES: TonB-dependent receptor [Flavobacterium]|uniref:TonB-dependent receptor n=1 Tax=Flavobacterium TaxID=237 RepID=UPI001FCBDF4F|nr:MULTISPECIES: TonB-dependent receptor [Flavobacterium]UOK41158.1 TonB-dependent receptor [Flavobacterium enshiense]
MKSPIQFLLAIIFFTLQLNAQNNGTIKGEVITSKNLPLEKVTITTKNGDFSGMTNAEGNFSISNVKPGKYTLIFSHVGFISANAQVSVKAGGISVVPQIVLVEASNTLSEVIVSGSVINRTLANGKAGIKTIDLPQSVQVINRKMLEQQQVTRLSDVIKNVNGVYVGSARGGAQESLWSRGYDMTANNMFKNGFRYNGGSMPEVASLEQVEALMGSSALLFGNVAPGGILNMVTKTPNFTRGGSVSFQAGSYAYYKPTVDFYGPLNSTIAYRFIGSYENAESFRDVVTRERFYVNPSVLFKAGKRTYFLLQSDYLRDNWTPDFGTGAIGREVVDLPRNTYLGARWSNGLTTQASFTGQISHKFHKNWKFSSNTSFQDYGRSSEGTERIQPAADGTLNRPLGKNKNLESIAGQQFNLQGTFNSGSVRHQLSTGVDTDYSFTQGYTYVYSPANYDTVNIYDPSTYETDHGIPEATNTKIVKTEANRVGVYAQDLVSFTEKIKLLAGIRWSWQQSEATTYNYKANEYAPEDDPNPKTDPKRIDAAFSPKVGLVYQPVKNTSIFASYANSFTPNTGVDIYNQPLEASIIDQFETGVKKDFWNGILTANLTLYQIVNNNLAQTAEFKADGTNNTDPNVKALSGQTTSKGIEVGATVRPIEGMDIVAGYSYNDMRYTKTSGLTGSYIEGDRLVRTPANTANMSFFYTIPDGKFRGLSVGTIANYIGERIAGWNNTNGQTIPDRTIPLDGYTTIDVSAGYKWRQFSILCRLSNITNELNYTVHENYSVNPIAPRQVMTTLKYQF